MWKRFGEGETGPPSLEPPRLGHGWAKVHGLPGTAKTNPRSPRGSVEPGAFRPPGRSLPRSTLQAHETAKVRSKSGIGARTELQQLERVDVYQKRPSIPFGERRLEGRTESASGAA